jgi:uncharacterized protein YkwD
MVAFAMERPPGQQSIRTEVLMIRPTFRRRPLRLESLESRELLTAGGPSAEAQYMLELINMARTNPAQAASWVGSHVDPDILATLKYYNVDLNQMEQQIASAAPRPPVAWNDVLKTTATGQSQDQLNMGVQTHTGANGSSLSQRLDNAGYTNRASEGENAYAYSKSVDHAMEAFLIDWGVADQGHRRNILQPDATPDQFYREVGIGIVQSNRANFGPEVITQDYGRQANSQAELLGVAFNDLNNSGQYSQGEGQGNVEIDATNVATGVTQSTLTWDNGGGYQIPLAPGTYNVIAKDNGQVVRTQQVSISDQNVKVDYNLSNAWQQGTPAAPVAAPPTVAPQVVSIPQRSQPQPAVTSAAANNGNTSGGASWTTSGTSWTARKGS